ncbi:hypothetical protein FACS1894177_09830 [Bacteroidia bacterium]|nr:hypothetical protein FACS1894177_09830 [Bacteroidia bacterium]
MTDEDGPYIELMTGVYTDNQPDFSWIQPYEEKSWTQYFMPYAKVGYVKNANKEAVVNMETNGDKTDIIIYTTAVYKNLRLTLQDNSEKILLDKIVNVSPENPYRTTVHTGECKPEDLQFNLYTEQNTLLISYKSEKEKIKPSPAAGTKNLCLYLRRRRTGRNIARCRPYRRPLRFGQPDYVLRFQRYTAFDYRRCRYFRKYSPEI